MGKKKTRKPNFSYNTIDYYLRNSRERKIDLSNLETDELRINSCEIILKEKRKDINIQITELLNFLNERGFVLEKTQKLKNKEIPLRIKHIERISKDHEKDDGYSKIIR
jgi:hypothetical protein